MTGSVHISLFQGTLHVDKIDVWFQIANITHALPVPVYRQTAFTPKRVVVSRLHDTVARFRTGVNFSLRYNNRDEHTPGWLAPAWHLVVVSCKQIQSHEREREWTRSAAKIAPVFSLFINIWLSCRPQTYCWGKEIVSDMTQTTITYKCYRLQNFGGNKMAAHDEKIGCNTIENTAAFLYSDWLYFLWHGINRVILKV